MSELDFTTLRTANRLRQLERNPAVGIKIWTLRDWVLALIGEAGELCNIVKKLQRIDIDDPATHEREAPYLLGEMADELGDVVIYADLLAERAGIDLGAAVARKFNQNSAELKLDTVLPQPAGFAVPRKVPE